MKSLSADKQAARWKVTQSYERREMNAPTLHLNLGSDLIPFRMVHYFFSLASSFLMSVFILHVTVGSCAPSDRYLCTPLHIIEPTPSVLILSRSSLSQTVAESMSVQFTDHFKWYVPASRQCSIFPSQRGRLLLFSDAHSTFSYVSSLSTLFILILPLSISAFGASVDAFLFSVWIHTMNGCTFPQMFPAFLKFCFRKPLT